MGIYIKERLRKKGEKSKGSFLICFPFLCEKLLKIVTDTGVHRICYCFFINAL